MRSHDPHQAPVLRRRRKRRNRESLLHRLRLQSEEQINRRSEMALQPSTVPCSVSVGGRLPPSSSSGTYSSLSSIDSVGVEQRLSALSLAASCCGGYRCLGVVTRRRVTPQRAVSSVFTCSLKPPALSVRLRVLCERERPPPPCADIGE